MRHHSSNVITLKRRQPSLPSRVAHALARIGLVALIFGAAYPTLRDLRHETSRVKETRHTSTISGRVSHVRDGDTIEVGATAIRFAKLDCAERGTAAGERATRRMKGLAQGAKVTCTLHGRRSYDREIGTCQLADGRDLGRVMIETGTCARYR